MTILETSSQEQSTSKSELPPAYITVHTKDDGSVQMDLNKVTKKSKVLADMLQHLEIPAEKASSLDDGPVVPVGSHEALVKVNQWLTDNYDKESPKHLTDYDLRVALTEENIEFMEVSNKLLLEMLQIANFLDIPDLIEIITQKIANMCRNKSVDALRKLFMLPDDLTPEEKAEIREKHAWAQSR